jgi:hypothetical protein
MGRRSATAPPVHSRALAFAFRAPAVCARTLAARPLAVSTRAVRALALALPLAAALAAPARADLMLRLKGHIEGFKVGARAQEPRDADVNIWLSGDKMRRDEGPLSAIVRLDRKKLYLINHTDKTYSVVDLPVNLAKLVAKGDQERFQQFVAESQIKARVAPAAETRKIHGWSAHRVDVELSNSHGLRVSTQMWLTKELGPYGAYNTMNGVLASLQPNSAEWSRKIRELDGFPVYQETTVNVGGASFKSKEEVVTVETKEVPDVTYDPPLGFNPVPYDPFRAPE